MAKDGEVAFWFQPLQMPSPCVLGASSRPSGRCRDRGRPRLPCTLGDMDTSDRLMAVPLRLQPCVQPLEICFPCPPVLLLRDPIHAYRCVGTLPAIGAFEGRHITHMRQRVEPSFGFTLRSFHSLHQSR